MNFFDAQDRARRFTRWLVVVYVISTVLIVAGVTLIVGVGLDAVGQYNSPANPAILGFTAVAATLFILGSTLYKTARLSSGGGRVAQDMGGTLVPPDVRDPLRMRLRNIVEEMAIASGVPVPEIYVLEEESGINAFAAGFTPGDAAIAVTRGTLELLEREELQGIIAHEFSHILNGDMRLNIRMMGVLFGIMVLGLIGRIIVRGSYHSSIVSSRRKGGSSGIMFIGLGLLILGWIGVFFARIIKAAVSRQREFLADASAVQFTRQTDGIANALKKIGGYSRHSYIQNVDAEEVSHMLFASGIAKLTSIFATHPPLTERIQALDPSFRENDYPDIDPRHRMTVSQSEQAAGFAGAEAAPQDSRTVTGNIAEAIGRPEAEHVEYARRLRSNIPELLYDAAHAPEEAFLLTIALVLNKQHADRQLHFIEEQLGAERATLVKAYFEKVSELGPRYRLPLLEIAFPMLKARPRTQMEYLLGLVRRLIEIDGRIDLGEFCIYRVLASHLSQAADPVADKVGNRVPRKKARRAAIDVIRIVADQGNEDKVARDHAYQAGISTFGEWASEDAAHVDDERTVEVLGRSLDALRQMNSAGRKSLLQAVSNTITHDGKLTISEAELLRAICASLDCPLPPLSVE
ncbi:MAG: M48 family metallopeptidase [Proteobacteria bacterium]|nr:M48 family metallopeptidase [Pseudomonadota bacterium]MCH8301703.1 M48 family metallopeptidase [Pseudomonadota bacterium]